MIWDAESKFSTHQAVAATALSDNVVKVPVGDIGKGRPVVLQVQVAPYTGSGTVSVEVQTDDKDDFLNPVVIDTLPIDNAALLKGGVVKVYTIPTGAKEYLRLNYYVFGTLAGGNISAGLALAGQTA